jgi:hypothetical protein
MTHLKNAGAAYVLALLAALFWFFKYHTSTIELSLIQNIGIIFKASLIFFLVFFVIYFGYSFVLRASKTYGATGIGLDPKKEEDASEE